MNVTATTSQPATRTPRRWLVLAGAIVALLFVLGFLAVVIGLVVGGDYPTTQTADRTFTIDEDFTTVRKILVRTDATKQIVTMTGDSEFIDQHWNTVGAGLEGIGLGDLKWRLELTGDLTVKSRDPYIGEQIVELRQQVHIDPDQVNSEVELVKPSERLRQYTMSTSFSRQANGSTWVRQRLTQEIVTDAPWFAHRIADARVHEAAERALERQEQAIRGVIQENRDRKWLLLP